MLLRLRGLDKKDLLEMLCAPVDAELSLVRSRPDDATQCGCMPAVRPEPLPASLGADFYGPAELPAVLEVHAVPPSESGHPMPFLDFPLWRGETSFADSIAPYYKTVKKFVAGAAQS
jgi:uncharacterized Zn finger protein